MCDWDDNYTPDLTWDELGKQEKELMKVIINPYAWNSLDDRDACVNNMGLSMEVYKLGSQIGAGNAQVYKVMRMADLKIFAGKYTHIKGDLEAETETLRYLQHDHILKVVDLYSEKSLPKFKMMITEFCGYGSVAKKLTDKGLRIIDMIQVTEQVASALDYIHEKGLYHSDVKPANIFIRKTIPYYNVVLGDCAEVLPIPDKIQEQHHVRGTEFYFSPEMMACEANTGAVDDIWALGITLLEMMAQCPDYEYHYGGMSASGLMQGHARQASLHARKLVKLNPRNGVVKLVAKMLDLDCEKRPTAKMVAEEAQELTHKYFAKRAERRRNRYMQNKKPRCDKHAYLKLMVPKDFIRRSQW